MLVTRLTNVGNYITGTLVYLQMRIVMSTAPQGSAKPFPSGLISGFYWPSLFLYMSAEACACSPCLPRCCTMSSSNKGPRVRPRVPSTPVPSGTFLRICPLTRESLSFCTHQEYSRTVLDLCQRTKLCCL